MVKVMAETLLFSTFIRALAEKKSTQKHAFASRCQAPDSQVTNREIEMLNNQHVSE